MIPFNRTKIVATLGPSSNSKEGIRSLVLAGVDVFRLNFSHGTYDEHGQAIQFINEINNELKTHVAILADLQGPKIRLGKLEDGGFMVSVGEILTFTTRPVELGSKALTHVTYEFFARDVRTSDRILIDDGKIHLVCIESNGVDIVKAEVIHGGQLLPKKGINLPDTPVSAASLSPKDLRDLDFIFRQPVVVNWIALSFVRTADEILELKGIIRYNHHPARIVAKIERPEAVKNIDSIIRVADAVMVARGDLGVEIPLERIPILQKDIVRKCVALSKPVIIATQMMESMVSSPTPTRAEITDVANAIFDGADALMLSGETATGAFPLKVIETFDRIIKHVEKEGNIFNKYHTPTTDSETFLSDAICYQACRIAENIGASAIVGMTRSGYTAFAVSSHRPQAAIFIFTDSPNFNLFSLVWGVRVFYYGEQTTTEDGIRDVKVFLKERGFVKAGDVLVHTLSVPLQEGGRTNTIKISTVN